MRIAFQRARKSVLSGLAWWRSLRAAALAVLAHLVFAKVLNLQIAPFLVEGLSVSSSDYLAQAVDRRVLIMPPDEGEQRVLRGRHRKRVIEGAHPDLDGLRSLLRTQTSLAGFSPTSTRETRKSTPLRKDGKTGHSLGPAGTHRVVQVER